MNRCPRCRKEPAGDLFLYTFTGSEGDQCLSLCADCSSDALDQLSGTLSPKDTDALLQWIAETGDHGPEPTCYVPGYGWMCI